MAGVPCQRRPSSKGSAFPFRQTMEAPASLALRNGHSSALLSDRLPWISKPLMKPLVLVNASAGTATAFAGEDLCARIERAFAAAGGPSDVHPITPRKLEHALDQAAAENVRLVLPETGVCSAPYEVAAKADAGCCGGPAPENVDACCVADVEAKAEGKTGCGCAPHAPPLPASTTTAAV